MPTHSFLTLYQLNASGVVVGSATEIVADSGSNIELVAGDTVTMDRSGHHFVFEFQHAAGDGFVATLISTTSGFPPGDYWFSDTAVPNGTAAQNDGPAFVLCFCAGTLIATPDGQVAIETLSPGDLVLTADGHALPVRWVGRQTVSPVFADPLKVAPIRIRAGALSAWFDGAVVPARDLRLSPDHALLLDGVLVQAVALVDGVDVVREAAPAERFAYYNIELAAHAAILAEGCPAETFVDNASRAKFDNYAEYIALYGADVAIPEMDLPRIKSARQLPAAFRAAAVISAAA